jgi:hypothetical protein
MRHLGLLARYEETHERKEVPVKENKGSGMRVLLLGGSGTSGDASARRLVASDLVSEVGVTGRNRDVLDLTVSKIGNKARAVQVDILDERRLASVAADYDVILNTAGPECEVLLPALRAAIDAGKHYCDIGADGATVAKQLELDSMAKERDIVAVPGIGIIPGLYNLLAVHAYRQFEHTQEIQLCHYVNRYYSQQVDSLQKFGRVDTSLQGILNAMSKPACVYADGRWTDVNARENRVSIALPKGGIANAYPWSSSQTITLPRYLPGIRSVSVVWGVPNPQLGELLFSTASQISSAKLSPKAATRSFLETIARDPGRWLETPPGPLAAARWDAWIVATGWKEGRRGRYMCWPVKFGQPHVVAALRILRGDVSERGVLPPEACFEPQPFFDEVMALMPDPPHDGKLLDESFEWLE